MKDNRCELYARKSQRTALLNMRPRQDTRHAVDQVQQRDMKEFQFDL
jgi:hypothetical protein